MVDVFATYPTKDVVASILALSRLQRASSTYARSQGKDRKTDILSKVDEDANVISSESNSRQKQNDLTKEVGSLSEIAHYAVFAHAAYGWKMGLLSGELHMGDLQALMGKTGIDDRHVISTNWKSKTHLPVSNSLNFLLFFLFTV